LCETDKKKIEKSALNVITDNESVSQKKVVADTTILMLKIQKAVTKFHIIKYNRLKYTEFEHFHKTRWQHT
jgi:hypothetical protein